jgi:hypothetical protein
MHTRLTREGRMVGNGMLRILRLALTPLHQQLHDDLVVPDRTELRGGIGISEFLSEDASVGFADAKRHE